MVEVVAVGADDGTTVAAAFGVEVGAAVGLVGFVVGKEVGAADGADDGTTVTTVFGVEVGAAVGLVGLDVGEEVGFNVGATASSVTWASAASAPVGPKTCSLPSDVLMTALCNLQLALAHTSMAPI